MINSGHGKLYFGGKKNWNNIFSKESKESKESKIYFIIYET